MKSLQTLMLADLKRSGLDKSDAEAMRTAPLSASVVKDVTRHHDASAYKVPYFDADGKLTDFYRLRFLEPVVDVRKGKELRYWQPPKTTSHLYLPPSAPYEKAFQDTAAVLTITEGEKKAYAGAKFLGAIVLAIGGNWSWKVAGSDLLIPELEAIACQGRLIELVPDGDFQVNPDVRRGWTEFARALTERGAETVFVGLKPGDKLDDLLVREGPDEYQNLPRVPVDAKKTISLIRTLPKTSARERRARVADVVLKDMMARGSVHVVDREPLFFDRVKRRLLSLADSRSSELRAHLSNAYGINGAEQEYAFVHEHVRGYVIEHGSPALAPLFAHFDRERARLYVDVGAGRVARLTRAGYELVSNGTDDVLFRACAIEPVEPAKRGSEKALKDVLALPNFQGGQQLSRGQQAMVWEFHFWSLLFPTLLPVRPLLLLNAVKGSGKSTGARALGQAIFGSSFDVQAVDRDRLDDLVVSLIRSPLVVLDNLDGRVPGLENRLCIASSGGKEKRRVLYTEAEQIEFELRARIIATSRQPDTFTRDDLRDRTIILSLERLSQFRAESDIINETLTHRSALWAYAFERLPSLVKALTEYKPCPVQHRLADFARFCLAVGPVLGHKLADVEGMLNALEAERTAFAGEHSNLLQALSYWIKWQRACSQPLGCERITAGELLHQVSKAWPDTIPFPFHRADTFGQLIKHEEATLRASFDVKREKGRSNATLITIKPREERLP